MQAVTAIAPDGSRLALFCDSDGQRHWGNHRCEYLAPGSYTAEANGDRLLVSVPDISGQVRTVKYKAVVIIRGSDMPLQRISDSSPVRTTSAPSEDENIAKLTKEAEDGDSNAQLQLADYYFQGDGVHKDYAKMMEWTRRSAESGNSEAQAVLGLVYSSDDVISHDFAESYFWYSLAAGKNLNGFKPEEVAKGMNEASSHLAKEKLLQTQERARKWLEDHPAKP